MAFERVKKIAGRFRKETSADKINKLREQVVGLSAKRDKTFGDVQVLEAKEGELFQQGKDSQSKIVRKRLAAQLVHIRRDLGRQNSLAGVFSRQIDVLSTDIHNLTLIEHGNMAQVTDIEEMTVNAVKAEELLERITNDADMATTASGATDIMVNEEELAILNEWEEDEKVSPESAPEAIEAEVEKAEEKKSQLADERIARMEEALQQQRA